MLFNLVTLDFDSSRLQLHTSGCFCYFFLLQYEIIIINFIVWKLKPASKVDYDEKIKKIQQDRRVSIKNNFWCAILFIFIQLIRFEWGDNIIARLTKIKKICYLVDFIIHTFFFGTRITWLVIRVTVKVN